MTKKQLTHGEAVAKAFEEAHNGGVTEETMQALETPHGRPTWVVRFDPDDMDDTETIQTGPTTISGDTLHQMGVAIGERVSQLIAKGEFPEHLLNRAGEGKG